MQKDLRAVVDTNVFFMSIYNPESKANLIIKAAAQEKINLFAPDTVKGELERLITRKFGFNENETELIIERFPVFWYPQEIYISFMDKTKIMPHKPDRPLVALALLLNCGILSANYRHFRHVKKIVKIWDIDELLKILKNRA